VRNDVGEQSYLAGGPKRFGGRHDRRPEQHAVHKAFELLLHVGNLAVRLAPSGLRRGPLAYLGACRVMGVAVVLRCFNDACASLTIRLRGI
jgi:hypothetical protein